MCLKCRSSEHKQEALQGVQAEYDQFDIEPWLHPLRIGEKSELHRQNTEPMN